MDRLANWIEIPANDIKRAIAFYRTVLEVDFHEMGMGGNRYALFGVANRPGSPNRALNGARYRR